MLHTVIYCLSAPACLPIAHAEIVINAVGDIMLAGSATATLKRVGYDYPFAATAAELKNGDISVGNLEAPLALDGTEFTGKRFRFKAAPEAAAALRKAGFSVLTLANNHIMDFGAAGTGGNTSEPGSAGHRFFRRRYYPGRSQGTRHGTGQRKNDRLSELLPDLSDGVLCRPQPPRHGPRLSAVR